MGLMWRQMVWSLALILGVIASGVAAAECRNDEVTLRGPWGQARFGVELAVTARERAQGLMHRESLSQSRGMLFLFPRSGPVGFWMRNTLIPLDMIFLDDIGRVVKVHHEAQPHDETVIRGGRDVKAVLEINGGLARQMRIVAGSEMRHPAFGRNAAWPCE